MMSPVLLRRLFFTAAVLFLGLLALADAGAPGNAAVLPSHSGR